MAGLRSCARAMVGWRSMFRSCACRTTPRGASQARVGDLACSLGVSRRVRHLLPSGPDDTDRQPCAPREHRPRLLDHGFRLSIDATGRRPADGVASGHGATRKGLFRWQGMVGRHGRNACCARASALAAFPCTRSSSAATRAVGFRGRHQHCQEPAGAPSGCGPRANVDPPARSSAGAAVWMPLDARCKACCVQAPGDCRRSA